jgi:hypothetical protein
VWQKGLRTSRTRGARGQAFVVADQNVKEPFASEIEGMQRSESTGEEMYMCFWSD